MLRYGIAFVLLLALAALAQDMDMGGDMAAKAVDFETDVLPLLEERCFKCHATPFRGRTRKPKGDMRLDGKGWILQRAVVPGKPAMSALLQRTELPDDHEDVMPPDGDIFDKEQLGKIRAWVAAGADFGDWTGRPGGTVAKAATPVETKPAAPTIDRYAVYRALGARLPQPSGVAIKAVRTLGARVEPVFPKSPLLRVEFMSAPDAVDDATVARALSALRGHVAILGLGETSVTDAIMKDIAKLPHLVRLDLQKTAVTDNGLAVLPEELRRLNLYGTAITDGGLDQLAKCRKLEKLYVWQSKATAAGVGELRRMLPQCKIQFERTLPKAAAPRADGDRRRRGQKKK
ncbi:MAG: hypothetical protein OER88_04710 [Planctomycetota bacterium]|nr:hypothetical protein [Planctomycetota bacterium]